MAVLLYTKYGCTSIANMAAVNWSEQYIKGIQCVNKCIHNMISF